MRRIGFDKANKKLPHGNTVGTIPRLLVCTLYARVRRDVKNNINCFGMAVAAHLFAAS